MGAKLEAYYHSCHTPTTWDTVRSTLLDIVSQGLPVDDILSLDNQDARTVALFSFAEKALVSKVRSVPGLDLSLSIDFQKSVSDLALSKAKHYATLLQGQDKATQRATLRTFYRQLETEKNLAAIATRQAHNFGRYLQDQDIYPNLRYIASRSVNRRDSHIPYYGIIRPINDPFWRTSLPPSGWNCKCSVRQTAEPPTTQDLKPIKNPNGIPGNAYLEKAIFTPKHPLIRNIKDPDVIKELYIQRLRHQRTDIKAYARENLTGKTYILPDNKGIATLSMKGTKEMINQTHNKIWKRNQLLYTLPQALKEAEYILSAPEIKGRSRIKQYHYFKLMDEMYLNVREMESGELQLYAITDHLKEQSTD